MGVLDDIIKKAQQVSKYKIYIPKSLRKYLETEKTSGGTRLKKKNTSLVEYLENGKVVPMEENNLEEITDKLMGMWESKYLETSCSIPYLQTGKGGAILAQKWIQEEYGTPMTKKEEQRLYDHLLDGLYNVGSDPNENFLEVTLYDEEKPDGTMAIYRYSREVAGKRYGERWMIQQWAGGYGKIIKELTKEEFEQLTEGKKKYELDKKII